MSCSGGMHNAEQLSIVAEQKTPVGLLSVVVSPFILLGQYLDMISTRTT